MFFKALSWCWEHKQYYDGHPKSMLMLSVLLVAITWRIMKSSHEKVLLPPGPWGLPLIGSLLYLDRQLHICFAKLSLKYGSIFKLQMGRKTIVVITSPEAAKQVYKDNAEICGDHVVPATGIIFGYGGLSVGFAPYGEHWRMRRKLCTSQFVRQGSLQAQYDLRRRKVRDMVSKIYSIVGSSINICDHLRVALFNIVTNMLWGNTLEGEEKFHAITTNGRVVLLRILDLLGEANISDFFPMLARFDLQGKAREMEELVKWFEQIIEFAIDKRSKMKSCEDETKTDFLQVLLQLMHRGYNDAPFTLVDTKAMLLDMLLASTNTVATTVEWAMAELLNQPEILKKSQYELDQIVGVDKIVEEIHLPQLSYLNAIVKEILRLHVPGPFLAPRRARESCVIGGFFIPKGANIYVNVWAIQTDPKHWEDPLLFKPERFLKSSIPWDYSGNDHRYIPFGSGRRNCPGISLAEKLVPYLLASLLHSFNWEMPEGAEMDLSDTLGLDLKKKIPLVAIPSPRLSDASLYTEN